MCAHEMGRVLYATVECPAHAMVFRRPQLICYIYLRVVYPRSCVRQLVPHSLLLQSIAHVAGYYEEEGNADSQRRRVYRGVLC